MPKIPKMPPTTTMGSRTLHEFQTGLIQGNLGGTQMTGGTSFVVMIGMIRMVAVGWRYQGGCQTTSTCNEPHTAANEEKSHFYGSFPATCCCWCCMYYNTHIGWGCGCFSLQDPKEQTVYGCTCVLPNTTLLFFGKRMRQKTRPRFSEWRNLHKYIIVFGLTPSWCFGRPKKRSAPTNISSAGLFCVVLVVLGICQLCLLFTVCTSPRDFGIFTLLFFHF